MTGTITITWASSIENHKGMEVIGDIGGTGHTLAHLSACMEKFEAKKKGCCELIDINEISGISEISEEKKGIDKAYLLIVRGGIDI